MNSNLLIRTELFIVIVLAGMLTACDSIAPSITPASPPAAPPTAPDVAMPDAATDTTTEPSPTLRGGTPAPTPTPTEGELASAAAGTAKYSHYFPTVEECKRAVDNKEVKNCVAPDFIKHITRPEWAQLFPDTDFYVIGLLGRSQIYEPDYRRDLIAWQDGQAYSAETYDRLLDVNDIVITDTNRELIVKAFALMTLQDYLEQDIAFSDWTQGDWPGSLGRRFTYSITVWTKIQGLRMKWFFAFEKDRLWLARRLLEIDYHIGDYIYLPFEALPLPGSTEYLFRGQ